ncbi:MAG: molybdopterin-guanine dinucleotide biosynthesis protein MobB, partial [Acetobacteraceae bacterium]|nr:molybdopterin-guanine dinucleotide biosynthesis protein MobB [Acetobacteraceae bacterium]
LVATATRWALLHEVEGPEPPLPELLRRLEPVDLVLVEGFKGHPFPKLEVHRPALGKPLIWPGDQNVAAIASDEPIDAPGRALLPLNDPRAVTNWMLTSRGLRS